MRVVLTLDGRTVSHGTPYVMHHERLADPLDYYTREIAKISRKRNKTDADHLEIARLEFLGGMYTNDNGPCIPAWNILRCLQDGARRVKRGLDVPRGVIPLVQSADLAYEGVREPEVMWKEGGFSLRKTVGIQRSRTMRTRPIFTEWSAALPVEVDEVIFDPDQLAAIWKDAGRYCGIGEMRPIYGRFLGTMTEWPITEDDGLGEAAYELACAVTAGQIQMEGKGRLERHGLIDEVVAKGRKVARSLRKTAGSLA